VSFLNQANSSNIYATTSAFTSANLRKENYFYLNYGWKTKRSNIK